MRQRDRETEGEREKGGRERRKRRREKAPTCGGVRDENMEKETESERASPGDSEITDCICGTSERAAWALSARSSQAEGRCHNFFP